MYIRLLLSALLFSTCARAATFNPGNDPPYAAAILVEAGSNTVLFAHNPDLQRSPASTQTCQGCILVPLGALRANDRICSTWLRLTGVDRKRRIECRVAIAADTVGAAFQVSS